MRRIDKKMNDADTLILLKRSKVVRIAIQNSPYPYIVPLNYAYSLEGDTHCLYIHCASVGRKLDLLKANPNVGIEIDTSSGFTNDDNPSECSTKYQSIIGSGTVSIIEDTKEKVNALSLLMKALVNRDVTSFEEKVVARTYILKVSINEFVGKASG